MGWSTLAAAVMGIVIYTAQSVVAVQSEIDLLGMILAAVVIYSLVLFTYAPIRTKTISFVSPLLTN
jgi:accessory gene regulator protein AgrB